MYKKCFALTDKRDRVHFFPCKLFVKYTNELNLAMESVRQTSSFLSSMGLSIIGLLNWYWYILQLARVGYINARACKWIQTQRVLHICNKSTKNDGLFDKKKIVNLINPYVLLISMQIIASFISWRQHSNIRRYFCLQWCVRYCMLSSETFRVAF